MKTIIIGTGIAGLTCAQELRKLSPALEIELFNGEDCLDYSRPRLPDFIAGKIDGVSLFMHGESWYAEKGFVLHSAARVLEIRPAEKKVIAAVNGAEVSYAYDTLILSCGAEANRLPLGGADLPHVFALRTFDDANRILAHVGKKNDSAAVIGGGLLGLEAALALKEGGVKAVTVIETAPRLLPRQLDETGSALLQTRLEEVGLAFVIAAQLEKITPDSLVLKDGKKIAAQTVLLSVGVRSRTDLAKNCGAAVNRGVIVNENMRTSLPSLYACGDCAEFDGVVWGIVPAALEQAAVASRFAFAEMTGGSGGAPYVQTVPKTRLTVAGVESSASGKAVLTPEELASGLYAEHKKVSGTRYEKYVTKTADGQTILCGSILYGSREHAAAAAKLTGKAVTAEEIADLLKF